MSHLGKNITPKMAQRIVEHATTSPCQLSEVAQKFGVSQTIVYQLVKQSKLQAGRVNSLRAQIARVAQPLNRLKYELKWLQH